MKRILLIALMACTVPAMAQLKSATLTASGLTCSMCSKAIYKALLKVPFIKDVQADVEHSSYAMNFKEGMPVVIDDIKAAVEGAGSSVASMHVTALFKNVDVANDAHVSLDGINFHFLNVEKQVLSGEKTVTIVDKNYLPAKDRKKYGAYTKMKCFETGTMAACCAQGNSGRIYHVTL